MKTLTPEGIIAATMAGKKFEIAIYGGADWVHHDVKSDSVEFLLKNHDRIRIAEPEIEIPEGWTKWAGGTHAPVTMDTKVEILFRCGETALWKSGWAKDRWLNQGLEYDVIAYRVITPKMAPLGPEDVPPLSVIRLPMSVMRVVVAGPNATGVGLANEGWKNFEHLKDCGASINRSIPLTGKWDSTAWTKCEKEEK